MSVSVTTVDFGCLGHSTKGFPSPLMPCWTMAGETPLRALPYLMCCQPGLDRLTCNPHQPHVETARPPPRPAPVCPKRATSPMSVPSLCRPPGCRVPIGADMTRPDPTLPSGPIAGLPPRVLRSRPDGPRGETGPPGRQDPGGTAGGRSAARAVGVVRPWRGDDPARLGRAAHGAGGVDAVDPPGVASALSRRSGIQTVASVVAEQPTVTKVGGARPPARTWRFRRALPPRRRPALWVPLPGNRGHDPTVCPAVQRGQLLRRAPAPRSPPRQRVAAFGQSRRLAVAELGAVDRRPLRPYSSACP
mmetsp:Transcript_5776/g.17378  ORF Transcript_5776/g.17378 Transcript_5776/m.17378 type:complete len:304 (+) Transcript_5776:530-1441(+)